MNKDETAVATALIVDDRRSFAYDIVTVCDVEGIDAVGVTSVDDAISILKERSFDVLVCDMMMPHGDIFSELETMGGLRTGVFFCEYARTHFPKMQIYLLSSGDLSDFDRDFLFGLGIEMLRKSDTTQVQLAKLIKSLSGKEPKVSILDTVELKPGIFGLKIDLKKAHALIGKLRSKHMRK